MSAATSRAQVGPYALAEKLGSGGMSVVYEARHVALGKRVALKVAHRYAVDDELVARFLREGRAVARIQHPHVIEIFDSGLHEGIPYLAMPLLEGVDLARHLRARGRLALVEILELLMPVFSAVAAAHAAGIVHRDLKPANIFLASRERGAFHPIVLDFGISKPQEGDFAELTHSADVLGTMHYMAVEQMRSAKLADARSDQYSLGAILYECATGERPFSGDGAYELMHAAMTGTAAPPSSIAPGLPAAFDRIVLRAMAHRPEERFASVTELASALLALGDGRIREAWREEFVAREEEAAPAESVRLVSTVPVVGDTYRDAPAPGRRSVRWRRRTLAPLAIALSLGTVAIFTPFQRSRRAPASEPAPAFTASVEPAVVTVASASVERAAPASVDSSAAPQVPAPPARSHVTRATPPRSVHATAPRPVVPSAAPLERGDNGSPILE